MHSLSSHFHVFFLVLLCLISAFVKIEYVRMQVCVFVCVCVRVCKLVPSPFSFTPLLTVFLCPTPEFRSPSHGGGLNRSASLSCTERAPDSGSVCSSNTQIPGTPFQYTPDFCVRALTDIQFVKVTLF